MRKKFLFITIISLILICILQISSLAVIDQAQLFLSTDFQNDADAVQAMKHGVKTFQTLGYNIQGGLPLLHYSITDSKATVLQYIRGTGNNYAFLVSSHGNSSLFAMKLKDDNQDIYPKDISGYWHFVFLDSCSSMANDSFAQAFKTVGYSNRASFGWYTTVETPGSREWWSYFKKVAGTTNIRSACLSAADLCSNDTPIRIYGDKTWNGKAWDK